MAGEQALRYEGGRSLTFRDSAGGRRTVQRGHPFTVDAATARILLEDPQVTAADAPTVPRETPHPVVSVSSGRPPEVDQTPPQIDIVTANKPALLEYAGLLGLHLVSRASKDDVRAAIEAELKRRSELNAPLVDEAATAQLSDTGDQGGSTSADDPDASATGEADTPPVSTGAVTLGDLPDGAKV